MCYNICAKRHRCSWSQFNLARNLDLIGHSNFPCSCCIERIIWGQSKCISNILLINHVLISDHYDISQFSSGWYEENSLIICFYSIAWFVSKLYFKASGLKCLGRIANFSDWYVNKDKRLDISSINIFYVNASILCIKHKIGLVASKWSIA